MANFYDIQELSLRKSGEELCGDQVKISKKSGRTIIVLSDGLGSGVKASILATLTSEIVTTMLEHDVPLGEVIKTVIGTLPICKIREMAYATFSVMEIDERSGRFKVINFDNPPIFHMRKGMRIYPPKKEIKVLDKILTVWEGSLEQGDFVGMASDGVLYAGLGGKMNFGWGWEDMARFIENALKAEKCSAREVVAQVIRETRALYDEDIGDDATFIGLEVRERQSLVVFTGPPSNKIDDKRIVHEFLSFEGKKVVCGGTTANIVSAFVGSEVETDMTTISRDVPPVGKLPKVELVTEGILTLSKALDYVRSNRFNLSRLKKENNGAALLASTMVDSDYIQFVVGQTVNPFYQNPLLPRNVSIRVNLIKEFAVLLRELRKDVDIRFC